MRIHISFFDLLHNDLYIPSSSSSKDAHNNNNNHWEEKLNPIKLLNTLVLLMKSITDQMKKETRNKILTNHQRCYHMPTKKYVGVNDNYVKKRWNNNKKKHTHTSNVNQIIYHHQ